MKRVIKFDKVWVDRIGWEVPRRQVTTGRIARQQGYEEGINPGKDLGVEAKAGVFWDEDSVTLAVEAGKKVVRGYEDVVKAVYFGSESFVYSVKPSFGLVSGFWGLSNWLLGADMEFACRAGAEAVVAAANMVEAHGGVAVAVGSDVAQARRGDVLEFTAAAGAGVWLLTDKPKELSLKLEWVCAYTTDTPDFWRFEGKNYPLHGGRFTGEPAYFKHLQAVFEGLQKATGFGAGDYKKVAIHAPNLKFPMRLSKRLGFGQDQVKPWYVDWYGNPYTASVMIQAGIKARGLKEGERMLVLSFGSGAGGIGMVLRKLKVKSSKFKVGGEG